MKYPIQLFGPQSLAPDSVVFEIDTQVTVLGIGIPDGDFISFEFVKVSGDQRPKVCGCRLSPQILASIEGVQELQCPACEELTQRPVRLTPQNPVVVLDVPQNTLMRAIYNGDGLESGSVRVWVEESDTQDLTDSLRGCPPIYYPDEDQTWTDTGAFRCLADQVTIEYEQVNDCGRRRWFPDPTRPQVWTDTCCVRCLPDGDTVEVQQTNQCGDLRWAESEVFSQVWTDTGNIRCLEDEVTVEFEQTNQCGDRRWVASETVQQIWLPAGVHRCTGEVVELQEANQCGQLRWVECGPVVWVDTGEIRCLDDEETIEVEQTNQCGHRRWEVSDDTQTWTDTANTRCVNDGETDIVEVEQTNQCGQRRWVYLEDQVWTDTPFIRCLEDGVTIEVQQTNQCGDTRWADAGYAQNWVETGVERCLEGNTEHQEVNQCGLLRWTATGDSCADPVDLSVHSILSIVPVENPIIEGEGACWTVTLNTPVVGADLSIAFTLSGLEQDIHGYPAPGLVIPVGNIFGVVCVPTTDDAEDELTLPLCITALTSARVVAVPATSCLDVQDNDDVDPGDSVHEILSVTVDPPSAVEGTEFCWTVTLDAPVAGSDLNVLGVLSGDEQVTHGYANPSGVIPVGMSSVDLCVTTINDTISEDTLDLCLAVQLSPRITAAPPPVCADVTDDGDELPPATLPGYIGGGCFVDNPNTSISEYYLTLSGGNLFEKTPMGFSSSTWLPSGQTADNYEVRLDDTSDPALTQTGDTRDVWLPLNTVRDFRWHRNGPSPGAGTVTGTLRLRRIGEVVDDTSVAIDSVFVSIGVDCP